MKEKASEESYHFPLIRDTRERGIPKWPLKYESDLRSNEHYLSSSENKA